MTEVALQGVLELLEEATLSDPGALDVDESLYEVEGWDSMGMVMFISLVGDRFGVQLTVHDLRDCSTAAALADRIRELLA